MNLIQTRISGGGASNAVAHVLKMDGNEAVQVLEGSPEEAFMAEAMAMADGHKYGLRHIVINPDQELSQEQLDWMIDQINQEYGFADDDPMMLVKHDKIRSDGSNVEHYHLLRASSSIEGKVYDAYNLQKRNELIARKSEIEFGHVQTRGKHNTYVYHQLLSRGDEVTADQIKHLTKGAPAHAKFGSKSKAKAERKGVDLPAISHAIAELKNKTPSEMARGLSNLEKQHPSITIDRGDRRNVIVVRAAGEVLLNANKSLAIKAKAVAEILKIKQEILENGLSRTTDATRARNGDDTEFGHRNTSSTNEPGDFSKHEPGRADSYLDDDHSNQKRHEPDSGLGDAPGRAESNGGAVGRDPRSSDSIDASDVSDPNPAIVGDESERAVPERNGREDPGDHRQHLTRIQADNAAQQSQSIFARMKEALRSFITPADRLEADLAAKEPQVQTAFETMRAERSAFITPGEVLEANLVAQEAQKSYIKMRAELAEFKKEIDNDNEFIDGEDFFEITSSGGIGRDGKRAPAAEVGAGGVVGPGHPANRRKADERDSGRVGFGSGIGQGAVVTASGSTKSDYSAVRAIGDRVVGRKMGQAAKEIEPLRQGFAENSGMYNNASDLQIMPDLDDPMYVEKLMSAWSRSMANNGPRGP